MWCFCCWVAELALCGWHLDTRAEFGNDKKEAADSSGDNRQPPLGIWLLLGGGLRMDYKFI
ncbi:hypothetical protein [Campylobacter devanensis]|uniref:hypothetical protein n=1 Tax=Campylobacter devanensis TaxID=3161138 RepID=UPI001F16F04F|nr:hypothetical protein [Campylobacter sp. P160]